MSDVIGPSNPSETSRPPTKNKRINKRALRVKVILGLSGLLVVIVLIIVIFIQVVLPNIPGISRNIAVDQAVTDNHGLFLYVRSLSFYWDKELEQYDIMVDVKLQNTGNKDIDIMPLSSSGY